MRPIGQSQIEQDKNKRNVQIFCFGLLALMVFSTIGYAFFSNPNTGVSTQTGTDAGLRQIGDRWVFGSADKPISLAYSPEETENTSIGETLGIENYVSEPLFIDSQSQGITTELSGVFQYYSSRMQEACYGSCERNLPEKNCTENIIIFKDSKENRVTQQNKCVFINGDLRTVDAYIYKLFGLSS